VEQVVWGSQRPVVVNAVIDTVERKLRLYMDGSELSLPPAFSVLPACSLVLFPAVSVSRSCRVQLNFGERPFAFVVPAPENQQ